MKAFVTLMAATAVLGLSACKSEAPAPAAEESMAAAPEATAAAGNSMVGGAEMFADKPIATMKWLNSSALATSGPCAATGLVNARAARARVRCDPLIV